MDKVTRWEWHGSGLILLVLCLTGILIPLGVIYFVTHRIRMETEVKDAAALSDFLDRG